MWKKLQLIHHVSTIFQGKAIYFLFRTEVCGYDLRNKTITGKPRDHRLQVHCEKRIQMNRRKMTLDLKIKIITLDKSHPGPKISKG